MIVNGENAMESMSTKSRRPALVDISNKSIESNDPGVVKKMMTRSATSRLSSEAATIASNATNAITEHKGPIPVHLPRKRSGEGRPSDPLSEVVVEMHDRDLSKLESKLRRDSEEGASKRQAIDPEARNGISHTIVPSASVPTSAPGASNPTAVSSNSNSSNSITSIVPAHFGCPAHMACPRRGSRPFSCVRKHGDPRECLDLVDQMYDVFYVKQLEYSVGPYMERQKDINPKMRGILIDWLVEIHYKFKLHPATIWLSVNIIDRYLRATETVRNKLQLVGIGALIIAAKFEELCAPEIKEFVYITDNAYDREDVLKMEFAILEKLNYDICVPNGYHFLIRYISACKATDMVKFLAFYYAERNLQEYDSLSLPPNVFAAAALYAALRQQQLEAFRNQKVSVWNKVLRDETGLEEADIIPYARQLVRHASEEPETASKRKLVAAKKKYYSSSYYSVSAMPLPLI